MKALNEFLNEGQSDKIEGTLANPGWKVVTYPRKIDGSKAEAHMGKIVSIKGNKLVVNFGGTVGGTTETLDLFKDIAITYDNIGYQSTYTVLDTEIIANADKENIHSYIGKRNITKFAALDEKEFSKAIKGTAMGDYINRAGIKF